ncbi:MAG: hypothetical protein V2I34_04145 [Bacteroidales bacterium]|jgi:hypothetical protein|nr:hypothetical protein [Bacteroidales bacterium]
MKKFNRISALLVLAALFATSGCNLFKASYDDLLTDHIWNFDKITTNSTDETVQGIVALTGAFMTGATLQFYTNGTYTITIMGESENGTWNLIDDDEVLLMDSDEMIIIELSKDELILEGEEVDNEYGTYSVTMYFEK